MRAEAFPCARGKDNAIAPMKDTVIASWLTFRDRSLVLKIILELSPHPLLEVDHAVHLHRMAVHFDGSLRRRSRNLRAGL
ncbi:protein of unknown function [Bradyrhizobium vignae]|uniref:Uncharacterized protein n=1 Tax=Bradyrhizobium vignae TaxID=1549949 RepID=A0A2U3Q1Y4_9BRAD|nr:protein of unknown function [Bradyrhizobium vignae]